LRISCSSNLATGYRWNNNHPAFMFFSLFFLSLPYHDVFVAALKPCNRSSCLLLGNGLKTPTCQQESSPAMNSAKQGKPTPDECEGTGTISILKPPTGRSPATGVIVLVRSEADEATLDVASVVGACTVGILPAVLRAGAGAHADAVCSPVTGGVRTGAVAIDGGAHRGHEGKEAQEAGRAHGEQSQRYHNSVEDERPGGRFPEGGERALIYVRLPSTLVAENT